MAARKRKRQKRKSWIFRLSGVSWLWILAVANLIAGLLFSSASAPKKVVAIGMRETDREGVSKMLSESLETPWLRLNLFQVMSKLSRPDWVESVEFSPNVFGRATLKMHYRKPVARTSVERPIYLDNRGNLYYDPLEHDVPKINLPADYYDESACISGTWPRTGVLTTVKSMKDLLPQLDYSLELDGKSVLSLQLVEGPRVILGPARNIPEKISVLARILSDESQKLNQRSTINLVSPDLPVKSSN